MKSLLHIPGQNVTHRHDLYVLPNVNWHYLEV